MTILALFRRYELVTIYVLVGGCRAFTCAAITTTLILTQNVEDKTIASAIGAVHTIPLSNLAHARTTCRDVRCRSSSGLRFAVVALCTLVIATGVIGLSVLSELAVLDCARDQLGVHPNRKLHDQCALSFPDRHVLANA